MAEVSEEELAELRARAAAAPPPPVMVEISEDELADLRARAAAASHPPEKGDGGPAPVYVAVLADGTLHEYRGAHPTHVGSAAADGGPERLVPVLSVHPKF